MVIEPLWFSANAISCAARRSAPLCSSTRPTRHAGTDTATVPLAVSTFVAQYLSNYNVVFAGLLIGMLPVLIVYFLMQRSIIKGFSGGLKA